MTLLAAATSRQPRLWEILYFAMMYMTIVAGDQHQQEVVISPQGDVDAIVSDTPERIEDMSSISYGVDISWPMQHEQVLPRDLNPLGDSVQDLYSSYLDGCRRHQRQDVERYYDRGGIVDDDDDDLCQMYETDRIEMNLLQPSVMENYTHVGYAKVKTPPIIRQLLQKFWSDNIGHEIVERWSPGNTYVNHWDVPTKMLDVGREDLPSPLTNQQRWTLVQQVQSVLEEWTKQSLVFTSVYGIRIYQKGAILAPHVDRLPLVSSAIIHVAHGGPEGDDKDNSQPWILEVIGHDGKARNITMEDDDMLLYESHSIIHGRPFPLHGSYYANVFVHFEPYGHSSRHASKAGYGSAMEEEEAIKTAYELALKRGEEKKQRQKERKKEQKKDPTPKAADNKIPGPVLPPYIHPSEAVKWNQEYYFERHPKVRNY